MTPAAASSVRIAGSVVARPARPATTWASPKKSLWIDAVEGESRQRSSRYAIAVQDLAALPQDLADAGVFEVAGLGRRPPDEVGALVLAEVAVGAADDLDVVERDHPLGVLLLQDLEVDDHVLRVVVLDRDGQQHPGGVLGDVVAQRVAAPEAPQVRGGLGQPAGVEEGLAAGVLLVGGGLVRVGRLLARREDGQVARAAQVAAAGLVGAGEARRQGAVLRRAGSRRPRTRRCRVLVGGEIEGEDAVLDRVVAGLGVDRAFDEGGAGREVFLQDEEVSLPGGLARGLVAPGLDGDRDLAARAAPG